MKIRFSGFRDDRGCFSEVFRASDFALLKDAPGLGLPPIFQINESRSVPGAARGLHFQWDPPMGKLVRVIRGRMIDVVLDIRKDSGTLGKALLVDMPRDPDGDFRDWLWVPPGFAHGNCFPEEAVVEYLCSAEWNPAAEAGICPLSPDIDFGLCDPGLLREFRDILGNNPVISDKDKNAPTLGDWLKDERSGFFKAGKK